MLAASTVWAQDKYFGAKSTEALLTFEGSIQVKAARTLSLDQLNGNTPKAIEMQRAVDHQLEFLIGHFQSESFVATFNYPGVLGDKYKFKFIKAEPKLGDLQVLRYRFKGKSVFHTKVFQHSSNVILPLRLPANPETFYQLGVVNGVNRCTDDHYNSEGDLFYFWDPDKKGCPLKNNAKDVLRIEGRLERLANTLSTYPEYPRLYSLPELKISVFLGYIDDEPKVSRTQDDGYRTYKELGQDLVRRHFHLVEEKNFKTINYLSTFEKTIRNQLGFEQKVIITLLLSDSSSESKDRTFVSVFSEALKNSQLVAYDGHSGLGGNLDFERFTLEKLPSFYQIFFFNGCSSYPYFNNMYFSKKPAGKKNLEIITAGLPTLTSTSTDNMLAFLNPFIEGRTHSYQTIMRSLERSNADEGTYLMGVIGDEDNQFKPEGRISPSFPEIF
jgi:hypothetical protein